MNAPILRYTDYLRPLIRMILLGIVCGLIGSFFDHSTGARTFLVSSLGGFCGFSVLFCFFRNFLNTWAIQLNTSARDAGEKRIDQFLDHRRINYTNFASWLAIKLLVVAWLLSDIRQIEPGFRFWCTLFFLVLMQNGFERGYGRANRALQIGFYPVVIGGLALLQKTNPLDGAYAFGWWMFIGVAIYSLLDGLWKLSVDLRMIRHGFIVSEPDQPRQNQ